MIYNKIYRKYAEIIITIENCENNKGGQNTVKFASLFKQTLWTNDENESEVQFVYMIHSIEQKWFWTIYIHNILIFIPNIILNEYGTPKFYVFLTIELRRGNF